MGRPGFESTLQLTSYITSERLLGLGEKLEKLLFFLLSRKGGYILKYMLLRITCFLGIVKIQEGDDKDNDSSK